ncbi:3-oxoacyl-[acyl-carrier-protein] synthase I [Gibbsiella quercinecans]|uniref:3-oxoacyl-[acyl-carrier-protein] synthase 1 n=2 Tax=Gibbsiella TaxID=929812 RepID=A0A250B5D7_9GAMM|nr:beta-ketoacyl-ACP synthase I [Gibbsiella quercinecans]ATA21347.1 beta-ketoacyl-ACP synthase I [Gibbsiella quercinecans]RLM09765.1 beta-ketoacyl-[acyl-carrier-protein] synthase I [Gibbsiella quercinecans]RLM13518.1 beta-ketoacyl-[acyl-carrier-protein] synthase I [Gibbsiella quercinecans]RLM15492.1 beta-ketoacyl-[acyl-carrier-protein] synthase I [Gibbsiella quercinecans]TCT88593.1 3-oxoacyl-[acyl-carrier-protein] synthase I [Gibbsiella quercinecans]
MKRAVITGLGIVSSIGNNQQEVLASLQEGRSGITFSQELKDSGMRSHVWGNVKLDTTGLIDRKVVRFMSDASIYAYLSMQEAVASAGLTEDVYQNNPRVGLIAGSGGSARFQVFGADAMRSPRGLKAVGPYVVTKAMASSVSACLATPFKINGVNYSISSACATSAHCIGNAVEQIQMGKQDIVFAGGGEELTWEMACEFDAMGALSTKYNDTPEKASRTYDANRDGFVIAGGGGMVVVEELEHALARGAHIFAEVVGYGATSDGADMVAPSGEGAVRCMKMAMQGVDTPIDYINTHGTSTPVGDVKELGAIREVFGDNVPAISATKAMTGHSLGAAGVQETIYTLLMLEHGFIAPSINIETLDEHAKGMNIITEPTKRELTTVMTNGFGFGGTNATLTLRKYQA